jgi:hypothetical protein
MYHEAAALGATLLAEPHGSRLAIAFVIRIIILLIIISAVTFFVRRYRRDHPGKK